MTRRPAPLVEVFSPAYPIIPATLTGDIRDLYGTSALPKQNRRHRARHNDQAQVGYAGYRGGGSLSTSNAPVSQADPNGRETPRWSVVIGPPPRSVQTVARTASMAGPPSSKAWVSVGPPLSCSKASSTVENTSPGGIIISVLVAGHPAPAPNTDTDQGHRQRQHGAPFRRWCRSSSSGR